MKLVIHIDLENSAFEQEPMSECARILRELEYRLRIEGPPGQTEELVLRDSNGYSVGACKVVSTMQESQPSFEGYSVAISDERAYYGADCSDKDATRISQDLTELIVREFPGIDCRIWRDTTGSSGVTGPDDDVCEQIREWVENNWTSVL
jgi:hypothetical protein